MNAKEEDFPEKYRPIIRRLQQAVEVQEIRDNMEMEDTILEEFEILERRAMDAERKIELMRQQNMSAARLMKGSGLNDEDICRCFQIDEVTLKEWLEIEGSYNTQEQ